MEEQDDVFTQGEKGTLVETDIGFILLIIGLVLICLK